MEDHERPKSLLPTGVTASTYDLTLQVRRAASVIKRESVQKLISLWRTADVPNVKVEADVRDGCAVIRVEVERVTTKILRHLPCDIEGFPILVEQPSQRTLH